MEKLSKLSATKAILGSIGGVGVGTVILHVVQHTAPANMKGITKVLSGIGAIVLTAIAGDKAEEYIGKQVDEISESITKAIEEAKEDEAEKQE